MFFPLPLSPTRFIRHFGYGWGFGEVGHIAVHLFIQNKVFCLALIKYNYYTVLVISSDNVYRQGAQQISGVIAVQWIKPCSSASCNYRSISSLSLLFFLLVCLHYPKQILNMIPNGVALSLLAEKLSPASVHLCYELNSRSSSAVHNNYSIIESMNIGTMAHFILEDGIPCIKCVLSTPLYISLSSIQTELIDGGNCSQQIIFPRLIWVVVENTCQNRLYQVCSCE